MRHKLFLLLIALAWLSAVPTHAHHSFAATYFEDKVQKIEGNLVQFLYRNPHSFVRDPGIAVRNGRGVDPG